jgi:hypothetical protein
MPIPQPKPDEKKNDFISRCMSDKVMVKEYPDQAQRYAICLATWRKGKKARFIYYIRWKANFKWDALKKVVEKYQTLQKMQKISIEEGGQYWRVRVKSPDKFDAQSFRIIDLKDDGSIRAVIGCPKGQFKNGVCQVGTEIQAYLFRKESFSKEDVEKWIEEHKASLPDLQKAVWTRDYINRLPDAAFALILPGGEKDEEGKTTPRYLRLLPHHNMNVRNGLEHDTVDIPHLRNALARLPQIKDITEADRKRAYEHLARHARALLPSWQEEEEEKKARTDNGALAELKKILKDIDELYRAELDAMWNAEPQHYQKLERKLEDLRKRYQELKVKMKKS